MIGGNNNRRVVARLTKEGKIERLKDAPVDLGVRADRVTIDPVSGRYLIMSCRDEGKGAQCFEFDSAKNEYRLVEAAGMQWPFGRNAMPALAAPSA